MRMKYLSSFVIQIAIGYALMFSIMSCSQKQATDMNQLMNLTYAKTGINIKDPTHLISIKNTGIDLHGTIADNYTILISHMDMKNAINHITTDSVNHWSENEYSYMLLIYPKSIEDSLFGFSFLKSEPMLKIQIFK